MYYDDLKGTDTSMLPRGFEQCGKLPELSPDSQLLGLHCAPMQPIRHGEPTRCCRTQRDVRGSLRDRHQRRNDRRTCVSCASECESEPKHFESALAAASLLLAATFTLSPPACAAIELDALGALCARLSACPLEG